MATAQSTAVSGRIVEGRLVQPVPFASVVAYQSGSEQFIGGTTTDMEGNFELVISETVDLSITFIGFDTLLVEGIENDLEWIDLGDLALVENTRTLNEVEIVADKSIMEFQLDKRVFNVGQDLSSTGMSALELLNNVPSVNVNIEGQISLRGNTGVQILINGKPSVLSDDGTTALGTLTADMIESVEVITNPSAKYEAEGSSGIINIVLKKEEKKGFNGSVSANTGIPDNHSVGVSLNRRTENFNFFTQFGGGYRSLPSFRESQSLNLIDSTSVVTEGTEYRNERFANITLGTDYHINALNVVTLSGSFAYEDEDQPSSTEFFITDGEGQLISQYERIETTTAGNPKYQYDLQYEKKFADEEDHVLQFSTQGSFFGKEQSSEFDNVALDGILLDPDQQTVTNFFQRDFIYKLDYTDPIGEQFGLEAGFQYDINDVGNDFTVLNDEGAGNFQPDPGLTNDFRFNQKVLGVYGTGSYEGDNWGVKIGLRAENTDLNTLLVNTDESNARNYNNLFPSFHTSYSFSDGFSVQAGYSRRIYRPRLWDLNPFFNFRNNYNIRRGNPDLLPEFGDSYELTAIMIREKLSLNSSVYHLYTTNVIERVFLFEENVAITTPLNIGTRNQTGFELNGKYTPVDWFILNGDFNYGYFRRNGSFDNQNFDFSGSQWFTRMTGRFKLPADIEIELTGQYESPFVTVQGEVSGFAYMDIGMRKKLLKNKAVINLSIRDVFASRIRESVVNQTTFTLYDFSQRGRFIALGFSYSFGKGEVMTYSGRRY